MRHVVFGCNGPVGVALMEHLAAEGHEVIGVCRSGRSEAPRDVRVVAGDAADGAGAALLCREADVVFCCVGLPYQQWLTDWPPVIDSLLDAVEHSGARLVFADNLYAYGPRTEPLREDLPLTTYGCKPALRARLARTLMDAHHSGRAEVAIVRASDCYGPRARLSMLGDQVFARLLRGKPAQFVGDPDLSHAFTFVADFARALALVGEHRNACGEAWHVPNAPAATPRQIVELATAITGTPARLSVMPRALLSLLGAFDPTLRELRELRFQFDRPYLVDHAKFAARFGDIATPLDVGIRETVAWYREKGSGVFSSSAHPG